MKKVDMARNKIYVDPFINSEGEIVEYSITLNNDYKFDTKTQNETEIIIIENPKYIKYLQIDTPAYQFVRYYYEIISGKNSKSMYYFLNSGKTMFSNPRSVELFKILLPNLVKSENFHKHFIDFIFTYTKCFKEILHITLEYLIKIKSDLLFDGLGYEEEFYRYYSNSWYVENIVIKTPVECGPFITKEFCTSVLKIQKQDIIEKYVKKIINSQLYNYKSYFYINEFFELIELSKNFENLLPMIVSGVQKIYNKNCLKIKRFIENFEIVENCFENFLLTNKYCEKFAEQILKHVAKRGIRNIAKFHSKYSESFLFKMFVEFKGNNIIKPFIQEQSSVFHHILSALENKKIISDPELYQDFLASSKEKHNKVKDFSERYWVEFRNFSLKYYETIKTNETTPVYLVSEEVLDTFSEKSRRKYDSLINSITEEKEKSKNIPDYILEKEYKIDYYLKYKEQILSFLN